MKPVGFAALLLAALPMAAVAAQQDAKCDVEKPVTKAEVSAKLDADYADMDSNKDGKLTAAEIDARLVKSGQAKIEIIKKERDAAFAKLDANGDGSISRAEFDDKARLPVIKDTDAKPFLDRFDANKDGEISLEEFRGPTLANFAQMDLNHDGTVTPAEANAPEKTASVPAKKPTFKNTPSITR
jgi:hypothetical protein